ncbi:MAG TPA: hypothetical protein VHE12_10290 [bacterium]|nr:hypothetical protein [bacterium]
MIQRYFQDMRSLWLDPSGFFARSPERLNEKEAFRFANLTGLAIALELGLVEILSGSSWMNVVLVTLVMFLALPFLVNAWIYLWDGFLRLCAFLLGEKVPFTETRSVVAYSLGGFLFVGIGFGVGKWLALATFLFQVLGLEKSLKCSRWTAGVLVLFPLSLVLVLVVFTLFMFKVFQ